MPATPTAPCTAPPPPASEPLDPYLALCMWPLARVLDAAALAAVRANPPSESSLSLRSPPSSDREVTAPKHRPGGILTDRCAPARETGAREGERPPQDS